MKRIFLLLIAIVAIRVSYAQTEKGNILLGGYMNMHGNNSTSSDINSTGKLGSFTVQVNPMMGFFIRDNLALGFMLNGGLVSTTNEQRNLSGVLTIDSKSATINYGGGGFIRSYKMIGEKFAFFGNASALYSYKETESLNELNGFRIETRSNGVDVKITPGFAYFPSPKIGLEASFGNIYYSYSNSKQSNISATTKQHGYGLNISPTSLNIGMNFYF